MASSFTIAFELYDVNAKQDSMPSAQDRQPFADLGMLKSTGAAVLRWASYERDYFRGDSSFRLIPDDPDQWKYYDFGYWSMTQPGGADDPPMLTVDFSEPHSSSGIMLRFHPLTGDYPSRIRVVWYNPIGGVITDKEFSPAGPAYYVYEPTLNYQRVEVYFLEMSRPDRFAKLIQIDYGEGMIFDRDQVRGARVFEEINPVAAELGINTLSFSIYSQNADFNIMAPKGVFALLQKLQQLSVAGSKDGADYDFGTFYLEDWAAQDERNMSIKAISLLGVMDKTDFAGGLYDTYPVSDIIYDIFHSFDPNAVRYELDAQVGIKTITGWIPVCSHREALQQVAMAVGAVIDDSREDKVQIYALGRERPMAEIPYTRKLVGTQKVTMLPLVTGVDVTAHDYGEGSEAEDLAKIELAPGEHTITFKEPMHDVEVTQGASLIEVTVNQARIHVDNAGEVIIRGIKYLDAQSLVKVRDPYLGVNEIESNVAVEEATLIVSEDAAAIAQRIYDYSKLRHQEVVQIIYQGEHTGDETRVEVFRGQWLRGLMISLDINLSAGFITEITAVGSPEVEGET